MSRLVFDDMVTDVKSVTREQLEEAAKLVEQIVGPLKVGCLKHGPECQMRRTSCVVQSVRMVRTGT